MGVNGLETSELLYSTSFCVKRKNFLTLCKGTKLYSFSRISKHIFQLLFLLLKTATVRCTEADFRKGTSKEMPTMITMSQMTLPSSWASLFIYLCRTLKTVIVSFYFTIII